MTTSFLGNANVGTVNVLTADYRGHTPEELAEMAVDRIIYIGGNSHPVIVDQARAYRAHIKQVLIEYFRMAQESERTNICGKLIQNGNEDIANLIRSL